jgi:hypothetical protein
LFSAGSERGDWQMRALSLVARRLMALVDETGTAHASGPAAKELQVRLLVDAHEEHTASGKHITILKPWPQSSISASEGRRQLEEAAAAIGAQAKSLPWNRKRGTFGT